MLNIQQKLTPYNRTITTNKHNKYIVIHYVGAVSTAKNNATYYYNNKLKASAHYFVDETSIWQCVDDKNIAWHCGGGLQGNTGHKFYKICTNSNSIGIEMCCKQKDDTWYFEKQTEINAAELVKYLMNKYNIPIECVIRHYDVTGKICPEPYINQSKWENFKTLITESEELMITQYEELKDAIKELTAKVEELSQPEMVYNYIDNNMPEWARCPVKWAVDNGIIQGTGEGLGLDDKDLKYVTMMYRMNERDKK